MLDKYFLIIPCSKEIDIILSVYNLTTGTHWENTPIQIY